MIINFQHQYDSPKTTTAFSDKNCIRLPPATILTFLDSGSLNISFNLRSSMRDQFNNILIENNYEVCLILIKEIFRFKFNTEMFSRFECGNELSGSKNCEEIFD